MSTPGSGLAITATDPRLLAINGIGQTVITALTIIGSIYLLIALWRQGRGKLRVRLLLGMIYGDLLLGVAAFVPNVWVLSGGRFKADTPGCNAFGFIYTSILFSQHIYTLMIAVATFLLLKYPISPVTYWVERHSGLAFPFAWGLAFAHAGAWWAHAGWAPSGPVCYYARRVVLDGLDSRDLVQFIPRAFVFITIITLYSMLYKFLRRPDTIQLSSQFVSGEVNPLPVREGGRKWYKWRSGAPEVQVEHSASKIDPNAPWEQLEFVQIGGRRPLSPTQSGDYFSPTQSLNHHGTLSSPGSRPTSPPAGATTPEPWLLADHRPSIASVYSAGTPTGFETGTRRPSESLTLVSTPTPEVRYQPPPRSHALSPVLSQGEVKSNGRGDRDIEFDLGPDVVSGLRTPARDDDDDDTPSGQTLKEFFNNVGPVPALESQAERGGSSGNTSAPQMSATAYFNRQASLLMLYFPLAYMLVFSVSLIRLIYDMIHKDVNPALQIVSAWMVLSVGLIDAIVYGLAEFMVKRKVRRKMGDRL